MAKTYKLKEAMRSQSHTIASLSRVVGISPTALFNKMHNTSEFNASEIMAISEELKLSKEEAYAIFFTA